MLRPIILFIVVWVATAERHNSFENEIDIFLNKWKEGGIHTDFFSFPSLKDINIGTVESYYEGMGMRMDFSIYNMNLTGVDNFIVKNLEVTPDKNKFNVSINLEFPALTLFSDHYNISGKAYYVYPLNGEGNMSIRFLDTSVTLKLYLSHMNQTGINLKDLDLDFNVEVIKVDFENSSWPLNTILNSKGVMILKSYREDIKTALRFYVLPYLNNVLSA
ncbi:unnamed protein product [Colias eurytheme]|nr:unnamed protein product [Colias eurytheme]